MFSIRNLRAQSGLTLIELMIAMVISIIVVGGMVVLMANSLGASRENITAIRLTDQLRLSMQMMSRDIRRAGFYPSAIEDYGTGSTSANASTFTDITISNSNDCILFRSDIQANNDPTDNIDFRGFRLVDDSGIGVVQVRTQSGACGDAITANAWSNVTDPNVVDVTTLSFTDNNSYDIVIDTSDDGNFQDVIQVRKVLVELTANSVTEPGVSRRMSDEIRIRNDRFLGNQSVP